MQSYSPPAQRDVPASIFSTAGWIEGSFMLPKLRNMLDFLNQNQDFLKLKDVRLPGLDRVLPFFAFQRQSMIFAIPQVADEAPPPPPGERIVRGVSCAINAGILSGKLEVLAGTRVSDYLLSRNGFFPLQDCSLFLRSNGQQDIRRGIPSIFVNARQLIGVAEPPIF